MHARDVAFDEPQPWPGGFLVRGSCTLPDGEVLTYDFRLNHPRPSPGA